jgi:hypothetical protein
MPAVKKRGVAKPSAAILLDGNLPVALVDESHVHHVQSRSWFLQLTGGFATCPITQGTLLRLMMRVSGLGADQATALLMALPRHSRHHFWPDSLPALRTGSMAWSDGSPSGHGCLAGAAGSASRRHVRELRPGLGRVAQGRGGRNDGLAFWTSGSGLAFCLSPIDASPDVSPSAHRVPRRRLPRHVAWGTCFRGASRPSS